MKIQTRQQTRGSILMLTIITISVIGVVLATYLNLVSAQNTSVSRSQMWNTAIPAAEAGLEEALSHLNSVGTNYRGTNGWTVSGNFFTMSRTLGDSRYVVTITTNDPPIVTSTGYLKVPFSTNEVSRQVVVNTTKLSTGMKGLVALGGISFGPGSVVDSWDSRVTGTYSASGVKSNGFTGAVGGNIANGLIKGDAETGPGYYISSTVTGSTNDDLNLSFPDVGQPFTGGFSAPGGGTLNLTNYYTSTNTVITNTYPASPPLTGVVTNNVMSTNTTVPAGGYYSFTTTTNSSTWPGAGYAVTTNTGSSVSQNSKPADGTYVPPYTKSGPTYTFIPITGYTYSITNYVTTNKVFTYQVSTTATNITAGSYTYILYSGNYKTTSISMSGQNEMIVVGDAVLWVTASISLSGQAQITILPGASLTLYVGDTSGADASASFGGNGVSNMGGDTSKMTILGLPTAKSITIAGNGGYTGTVYAPEATLYGKGGGNDVDDFMGAAVVGRVVYNGHVNFHYDEKLGDTGGVIQWNIASWREY